MGFISSGTSPDGDTIKYNEGGALKVDETALFTWESSIKNALAVLALQADNALGFTDYSNMQVDIFSSAAGVSGTVDIDNSTMQNIEGKYTNKTFIFDGTFRSKKGYTYGNYSLLHSYTVNNKRVSLLTAIAGAVHDGTQSSNSGKTCYVKFQFEFSDSTTQDYIIDTNDGFRSRTVNQTVEKDVVAVHVYVRGVTNSTSYDLATKDVYIETGNIEGQLFINPEETITPSATALYAVYSDGSVGEVQYVLNDGVEDSAALPANQKNSYSLSNPISKIKAITGTELTEIKEYVFIWW